MNDLFEKYYKIKRENEYLKKRIEYLWVLQNTYGGGLERIKRVIKDKNEIIAICETRRIVDETLSDAKVWKEPEKPKDI